MGCFSSVCDLRGKTQRQPQTESTTYNEDQHPTLVKYHQRENMNRKQCKRKREDDHPNKQTTTSSSTVAQLVHQRALALNCSWVSGRRRTCLANEPGLGQNTGHSSGKTRNTTTNWPNMRDKTCETQTGCTHWKTAEHTTTGIVVALQLRHGGSSQGSVGTCTTAVASSSDDNPKLTYAQFTCIDRYVFVS